MGGEYSNTSNIFYLKIQILTIYMDTGIKVGDCMKTELITIRSDADIFQAARKMKKYKVGSLIVTEKRKKYAILTESDLVNKALAKNKLDIKVKDIASSPLLV